MTQPHTGTGRRFLGSPFDAADAAFTARRCHRGIDRCRTGVAPEAAYALLAGLPSAYGLYAAIAPVILAALFGSSRQMVSGPAAALSIALNKVSRS